MRKSIFIVLALAIFAGVFYIVRANPTGVSREHFNSNLLHRIASESKNIIGIAHAEEPVTDTGIVKGIFTEKIDGIDYQKEVHYGRSGLFTLEEMTANLGVEIYNEDRISLFPDPKLGIGSKIEILRANPITVIDAKIVKNYRSWAKTVGEFFEEQGIEIGEQDIVGANKEDKISRDLEIKIIRVGYTELIERELMDYKTIYEDDPNLEKGTTRVKQYGKKGVRELTYRVRRENGEEASRKLVKNEITEQPENKVLVRGTKVVSYGSGTATWYDWIGGMTAAHNSLAYGTMIRVVNEANGKEVVVKIIDHGIRGGAIIDLSDEAFSQLAPLSKGKIQVRLEKP